VINGAGLVGKIETAWGGGAVVTLITDPEFATGGITSSSQEPGSVVPAVGAPGDLLFKFVDNANKVRKGEIVYTAGTISSRLESRYPPAIPIGTVDKIDLGDGELDKRIHIKPAADLRRVDMVQVLTEPHADLASK
jgi:rod shape-determining protein MreC